MAFGFSFPAVLCALCYRRELEQVSTGQYMRNERLNGIPLPVV